MKKMTFDREFVVPSLFFLLITILVYLWQPLFAIIPGILTIGSALFFRDPHREISDDQRTIVSPADGKVMGVEVVKEDEFFKTEVKKITIFLSIFDVHINRSPIEGEVTHVRYSKGKFLAAYKENVGSVNERNQIFIKGKNYSVLVVQIAGLIARRIVCRVQPGSKLQKGERLGLIRFGSCTELYVPKNVKILVEKGSRVKGGETIIGEVEDK